MIVNECPFVADRAFSVTKKSAASIFSNPLNISNTFSRPALSCLIARVVMFKATYLFAHFMISVCMFT